MFGKAFLARIRLKCSLALCVMLALAEGRVAEKQGELMKAPLSSY